jgi:polyribonucleotide nucleotidyltransferase
MHIVETIEFHGRTLTVETGKVAKQADGSAWVRYGDAVVVVSATSARKPKEGQDFFPLTVDYQEKTYAAGKIPGGYFKREGRPTEMEILTSRVIDRPIRPLFADGYANETQIVATMVSFDPEVDPQPLAIIGASVALHTSDIPFQGPIAAVRVGRVEGAWVVNPTPAQREASDLDVLVVASRKGIVMVEGGAKYVSEKDLTEALLLGEQAVKPVLDLQDAMRAKKGVTQRSFTVKTLDAAVAEGLTRMVEAPYKAAQRVVEKHLRAAAYTAANEAAFAEITVPDDQKSLARAFLDELRGKLARQMIRTEKRRSDGRDLFTVRPITCEVGVLPRTHGSALFTRGETQVLVAATLGTAADEQRQEALVGDVVKRIMLHYNFPPYSVGEIRPMRGPSRRDIGHGNLAERGTVPSLPAQEAFPYTLRIVSEVMESNGSSSMATACGTSLALMDAGVPVTTPIAGVAMGLIKEEGEILVLTDILGDEDHYGDMDFKVVGNAQGITAVQMDIKIDSINEQVLMTALEQARQGRLHILGEMAKTIAQPREKLSPYAPQIVTLKINPDKIRFLIGPGGKTIKGICEKTGAEVNVEDDGTVQVAALGLDLLNAALDMVKAIVGDVEPGKIYQGKVTKVVDFGCFVELQPGTEGLVHVSELAEERVEHPADLVAVGDVFPVKVLGIDPVNGKIRLSKRDLTPGVRPASEDSRPPRRDDRGPRRDDRGPRRDDRGPRRDDRGPRRDDRGPRRDYGDRPRHEHGGERPHEGGQPAPRPSEPDTYSRKDYDPDHNPGND